MCTVQKVLNFSCLLSIGTKPMSSYVALKCIGPSTMASWKHCPEGFQSVLKPKATKKAKTTPMGAQEQNWQLKWRFTWYFSFYRNNVVKSTQHTRWNCWSLSYWNMIIWMICKHWMIAMHSTCNMTSFQSKKRLLHSISMFIWSKQPIYQNQITIGCWLLSTKLFGISNRPPLMLLWS